MDRDQTFEEFFFFLLSLLMGKKMFEKHLSFKFLRKTEKFNDDNKRATS